MLGRFASHCYADVRELGERFSAVRAESSATQLMRAVERR
jgi:hypothetical protein